jgi:hypothetical protein
VKGLPGTNTLALRYVSK